MCAPYSMQLFHDVPCCGGILHKSPNDGQFFNRASFETARVMKDESRPGWKSNFIPHVVETALPAMQPREHSNAVSRMERNTNIALAFHDLEVDD